MWAFDKFLKSHIKPFGCNYSSGHLEELFILVSTPKAPCKYIYHDFFNIYIVHEEN